MPVLGFHTDGRRTKEMLKAGRARLDLTRQFVRGQEFWSLQNQKRNLPQWGSGSGSDNSVRARLCFDTTPESD